MGIHVDALPLATDPEFLLVEDLGTIRKISPKAMPSLGSFSAKPHDPTALHITGVVVLTDISVNSVVDVSGASDLMLIILNPLNLIFTVTFKTLAGQALITPMVFKASETSKMLVIDTAGLPW